VTKSIANLNAFCESAEFAAFACFAVDDALSVEVASKDFIVAGLNGPPEESSTTGTNLATVGSVFTCRLSTNLLFKFIFLFVRMYVQSAGNLVNGAPLPMWIRWDSLSK
jgi:hypothetical protein